MRIVICALVALFLLQDVTAKINGMAFTTGHDTHAYRKPEADVSLAELKKTGCNYVHISAYARMPSLTANYAIWETDDASIRYIVRKLKQQGFRVFFKPVIEIPNVWRGYLPGTPQWFVGVYEPFIMHMARIAQQEGVDLLAVGSEYRRAENKTEEWTQVIRKVRTAYSGTLTYVANHDSYERVKFFNELDIISISAYFPLIKDGPSKYGPSPTMGKTLWLYKTKADAVEQWWRSSNLTHKQIIVAEFGIQSKGGGVVYRVPWDWNVKAPVNFWEQVKMYESFFNAFMPRAWCAGVFVWHWEAYPNAGKWYPSTLWYTPQNKPALKIMEKFFRLY